MAKRKDIDWSFGLCSLLELPTSIFYPPLDHLQKVAYAKSICNQCELVNECYDNAQSFPYEEHGIWGGATPDERKLARLQAVLHVDFSHNKKPHEQEHPKHVDPVSPSHTYDQENHSQPALSQVVGQKLSENVGQIKLSQLLQPEELSSDHNQKTQIEHLRVSFSKFLKRRYQTAQKGERSLIESYLSSSQTFELKNDSHQDHNSKPRIQLFFPDQSQEQ